MSCRNSEASEHRESYFITNHVSSHLRKTYPYPEHPVMKDNIYFSMIQSWDPAAGQEVEANLTDD